MDYEVEVKCPVADVDSLQRRLDDIGYQVSENVRQVDEYFQHPARDFAKTDEALRLRRVGSRQFATYKGPRVDGQTKTRQEIELPLDAETDYRELLEALGFRSSGMVSKHRRSGSIQFQGRAFTIALDRVDGLGDFVELETVASESQMDLARTELLELAGRLELTDFERRSYLELLLDAKPRLDA